MALEQFPELADELGWSKEAGGVGAFFKAMMPKALAWGSKGVTGLGGLMAKSKPAINAVSNGIGGAKAQMAGMGKTVGWGAHGVGPAAQARVYSHRMMDGAKSMIPNAGQAQVMGRNLLRPTGGQMAAGGRMLGGAMTGYDMAEYDPNSTVDNWLGAGAGALFGRAMPMMGPTGNAMGRRAFMGDMVGSGLDSVAGMAGMEDPRFAQTLAWGGAASPLVPGLKRGQGKPGGLLAQTGQAADDFAMKPWQGRLGGLHPGDIAKGVMDPTKSLAQRAGTIAGPGLTVAGVGTQLGGAAMDKVTQRVGEHIMQSPEVQGTLTQMNDIATQVQPLLAAGKDVSGVMNQIGGMVDGVLGPILQMFGQDVSTMSMPQKLMLLLGGGALLGGGMGGGAAMGGLGGLAMLAGLMGMGGEQTTNSAGAPPPPAQGQHRQVLGLT